MTGPSFLEFAAGTPNINKINVKIKINWVPEGMPGISGSVLGQTWPQCPSRTTGLVVQCRLHQKSARQTDSKATSRCQTIPARLPSGTQSGVNYWSWVPEDKNGGLRRPTFLRTFPAPGAGPAAKRHPTNSSQIALKYPVEA